LGEPSLHFPPRLLYPLDRALFHLGEVLLRQRGCGEVEELLLGYLGEPVGLQGRAQKIEFLGGRGATVQVGA